MVRVILVQFGGVLGLRFVVVALPGLFFFFFFFFFLSVSTDSERIKHMPICRT